MGLDKTLVYPDGRQVADRCLAMAARMHRMYADAVAEGSYPRGRKGRVKEGVARYRRELEELRKEADW